MIELLVEDPIEAKLPACEKFIETSKDPGMLMAVESCSIAQFGYHDSHTSKCFETFGQ